MLLRKIKMALTRLGFLGSCVLGGLTSVKNYKLAQEANRGTVYGAMLEITKNPRLWRSSPVGREYCHFTDEGREVIADLMQDILRTVDALDRKVVDQRAKEITIDILKGK
jgi:hypothetical protein